MTSYFCLHGRVAILRQRFLAKVTIVKLLRKSKVLQHISEVFMNDDSSPDIIIGKASELSFKTTSKTYILSFSTRLYHFYLYIRICVYLSSLRKIKEIDWFDLINN